MIRRHIMTATSRIARVAALASARGARARRTCGLSRHRATFIASQVPGMTVRIPKIFGATFFRRGSGMTQAISDKIDLSELTVEKVQAGFASGAFTSERLTRAYLQRIAEFN